MLMKLSCGVCLNSFRCWDDFDSALWWIIKTPILISVFVSMTKESLV